MTYFNRHNDCCQSLHAIHSLYSKGFVTCQKKLCKVLLESHYRLLNKILWNYITKGRNTKLYPQLAKLCRLNFNLYSTLGL